MTTDKWSNPREAALDTVRDLIEEKKQTIDSGPLEGTEVVSIEDISEAFRVPLEPIGDFTAEVRTPGLVYVAGVCPACKETVNLRIDLTTELRIESAGRHLRLKGKSKEVTHYCGQIAMGIGEVEGQQGFDLDALQGEAVNAQVLYDLLGVVSDDFPADMPSIETIENWDEPTREIVRDWATAVYLRAHGEDATLLDLPVALGGESIEVVETEEQDDEEPPKRRRRRS